MQANDPAAAAAAASGGKRTSREAELQAMRERLDADMKQVRKQGGREGVRGRACSGPILIIHRLPLPTHNPLSPSSQVLHYCNEKAQLAQQVYDYVDARIRRLDTDLAAFDAQLVSDRVGAGLPPGGWAAAVAAGLPSAAPHKKAARGGGGAAAPARKAPPAAAAAAGPSGGGGAADGGGGGGTTGGGGGSLDPAEPVYCTCARVSFGEMIACDNPDCAVEWFHYECVGIREAPKGRWVCPSCAAAEAEG